MMRVQFHSVCLMAEMLRVFRHRESRNGLGTSHHLGKFCAIQTTLRSTACRTTLRRAERTVGVASSHDLIAALDGGGMRAMYNLLDEKETVPHADNDRAE